MLYSRIFSSVIFIFIIPIFKIFEQISCVLAILNNNELATLVHTKAYNYSRAYILWVAQSYLFHLHDCVIPHSSNNKHAYDQSRDIQVISVVHKDIRRYIVYYRTHTYLTTNILSYHKNVCYATLYCSFRLGRAMWYELYMADYTEHYKVS